MNWIDFVVIGIIAIFALWGFKKGLVLSVFKLVSFFVAVILSIVLSPLVAGVITDNTPIHSNISGYIYDSLNSKQENFAGSVNEKIDTAGQSFFDGVVEGLPIPDFLKKNLSKTLVEQTPEIKTKSASVVLENISDRLADFAVTIMSMIILFILFLILLFILRKIIEKIVKLPVIKQMDKIGGIAFGTLQGLLIIFIVFALLMLFQSNQMLGGLYETIDNSLIGKFFYEHNLIVSLLFSK